MVFLPTAPRFLAVPLAALLAGLSCGALAAGEVGASGAVPRQEIAAQLAQESLDLRLEPGQPGTSDEDYGDTGVLLTQPGQPRVDWSRARRDERQLNPFRTNKSTFERQRYEDDIPVWQPYGATRRNF